MARTISDDSTWSVQDKLDDLKGWLVNQPGYVDAGYLSSTDDLSNNTMTLLWYEPPASWQSAIGAEASQLGVNVQFQAANNNEATIESAMQLLLSASGGNQLLGSTVTELGGPTTQFDGITLGLSPNSIGGTSLSALSSIVASYLESAKVDVPVTVQSVAPTTPADYARDQDSSPFAAGGFIDNSDQTDFCSSGFGVSINGTSHTTTAQHCDHGPYYAYGNHGSTHVYGGLFEQSSMGGGRVLAGNGVALSFIGSWDETSPNFMPVAGYADLSVGDNVCDQGAMSGNHCGLVVKNLSVYNDSYTGQSCNPANDPHCLQEIQANNTNGGVAVAQGDSGGPVVTYGSDGVHIRAAGMIQALGGNNTYCSTRLQGPVCGSIVFFTSMRTIVDNLAGNAILLTD